MRGLSQGGSEDCTPSHASSPKWPAPRTLPPPFRPHQWSSCAGLARAGWRAERGHWLPWRDPRWAAVAHWLVASVCWTGSDPEPLSSSATPVVGPPEGPGDPDSQAALAVFGNLSQSSVPVEDWQGAGGLPWSSQSFCGIQGGAAVAGCEQEETEPSQGAVAAGGPS